MTRRPGRAGADNALPTYGLRAKVRRMEWATLTAHKWVISGERRGASDLFCSTSAPTKGVKSAAGPFAWSQSSLDGCPKHGAISEEEPAFPNRFVICQRSPTRTSLAD